MMVEHNQSANVPSGMGYDNKYKFNGKELDDATGMYYYGARYYDPRISIFISVDPLAEETMEPYLYTGNNPIMFTDPTGMSKDGIENEYTRYIKDGVVQKTEMTSTKGGDLYDRITDIDMDKPMEVGSSFIVPVEKSESTIPTNLRSEHGQIAHTDRGPGYRHDIRFKGQSQAIEPMGFDSPFFVVGGVFKLTRGKALKNVDEGIVYLRTDLTANLKPYVGQAKSETRFLARQSEHARKYPNSDFKFEVIDRANPNGKFPTKLDISEQRVLDRLGGPTNKSNPNGGTSNAKNVIRKNR